MRELSCQRRSAVFKANVTLRRYLHESEPNTVKVTRTELRPVHLNSSSSTILATLASCVEALLGTRVATNAPLMSSGMDSLAITAFTNAVSDQLSIETLATTMVFDHPSLDCIAAHMSELEAPRIAEPAADFVGRGSTEVAAALKVALEGACVGLMSTMGAPQKL